MGKHYLVNDSLFYAHNPYVEKNPYLLCSDGIGINFERACDIAERLPVKPADEYRIAAGVLYVVRHNLHNGHTCLPREKLVPPCVSLLLCSLCNPH